MSFSRLHVQLSEEVQRVLKDYRRKKPDTITFEIYTTFQQLVQLSENAQKEYALKFRKCTGTYMMLIPFSHAFN